MHRLLLGFSRHTEEDYWLCQRVSFKYVIVYKIGYLFYQVYLCSRINIMHWATTVMTSDDHVTHLQHIGMHSAVYATSQCLFIHYKPLASNQLNWSSWFSGHRLLLEIIHFQLRLLMPQILCHPLSEMHSHWQPFDSNWRQYCLGHPSARMVILEPHLHCIKTLITILWLLDVDVNAQNQVTLWTPLHAATFQEHGPVSVKGCLVDGVIHFYSYVIRTILN